MKSRLSSRFFVLSKSINLNGIFTVGRNAKTHFFYKILLLDFFVENTKMQPLFQSTIFLIAEIVCNQCIYLCFWFGTFNLHQYVPHPVALFCPILIVKGHSKKHVVCRFTVSSRNERHYVQLH